MPSPGVEFVCIGNIWTTQSSVNVNSSISVTSPIYIYGNLTVSHNSSLNYHGFDGNIHLNGCLIMNGSIIIILNSTNVQNLKSNQILEILSQSKNCSNFPGYIPTAVQTPKTCQKIGATLQTNQGQNTLSVVFSIDSSSCQSNNFNTTIILSSVFGGLGLIVFIGTIIIFTNKNLRRKLIRTI